ncbi:hypothetical protein PV04_08272 [Phialophora macrospora]|uniref:Uncharacterized protein n=1 Tax=Phialophora macrospora TaxID=1851006 RepID=A0A0D2FH44_9EURO|nr:hypothetical protein PV04_08272 [Phialophora macrospora]
MPDRIDVSNTLAPPATAVRAVGSVTKWPKITPNTARGDIPLRTRVLDLLNDCENTQAYIRTKPKTRAPNEWVRAFVENASGVLSSMICCADPQVLDSLVRIEALLNQVVEQASRVDDRPEGQTIASESF